MTGTACLSPSISSEATQGHIPSIPQETCQQNGCSDKVSFQHLFGGDRGEQSNRKLTILKCIICDQIS